MKMLEQLSHIAAILASFAAVAAPPAAVVAGLVPRIGPGRAVGLGLYSRLFLRAKHESQRSEELGKVRKTLSTLREDQYLIVMGQKGVGKTCLVQTATQATCGVVNVRVQPGTSRKEIMADVFLAISRGFFRNALDYGPSARRVLWWHRLMFRRPATVVLQADERKPTQPFADLDSAARSLSGDYGMRVIIDASNNSLPESAKATLREVSMDIGPMPRPILEQLPELEALHAALKAADLADVVWACIGGVPASYFSLDQKWEDDGRKNVRHTAAGHIQKMLGTAILNKDGYVAANERLEQLCDRFRKDSELPASVLGDMKLVRLSPDKVLRVVWRPSPVGDESGENFLIPADSAMALVLRFGLRKPPTIDELKALVRGANA